MSPWRWENFLDPKEVSIHLPPDCLHLSAHTCTGLWCSMGLLTLCSQHYFLTTRSGQLWSSLNFLLSLLGPVFSFPATLIFLATSVLRALFFFSCLTVSPLLLEFGFFSACRFQGRWHTLRKTVLAFQCKGLSM